MLHFLRSRDILLLHKSHNSKTMVSFTTITTSQKIIYYYRLKKSGATWAKFDIQITYFKFYDAQNR